MARKMNIGRYRSRKLAYAAGTSALIFIGAFVFSQSPATETLYGTLVSGLLGALGLYLTGNVGNRLVATRANPQVPADSEDVGGTEGPPVDVERVTPEQIQKPVR